MMNRLAATLLAAACLAAGGARDLAAQEVIYYQARQPAECGRLGIAFALGNEGVVIADLLAGAPGEGAGLRVGDEVERVNGAPVTMGVLDTALRALKPGEGVRFQLRRGKRTQEIRVVAAAGACTRQMTAAEQIRRLEQVLERFQGGAFRVDTLRINLVEGAGVRSEILSTLDSLVRQHQALTARARAEVLDFSRHLPVEALDIGARTVAGAEFSELNADLAQYFRGTGEGLLVLRVAPQTPGARAGLRPGDVVVRASGNAIRTIRDLRFNIARAGYPMVTIDIVRQGRKHELHLAIER